LNNYNKPLKTLFMKKYFLACVATISIAAIATSATNSNFKPQNLSLVSSQYDTTPGSHNNNRMDTSGRSDNNRMNNHSKNKNRDTGSNRGMHNMDSTANPPR
jgi:hypothetical protein